VGVRDPDPAPESLRFQLRLGEDATIDTTKTTFAKETEMLDDSAVGALQSDNVDLDGDASYVSLSAFPDSTPIPPAIPAPDVGGDDDDRMVPAAAEVTLSPGVYRDLKMGTDSLVRLLPGNYVFRIVELQTRAWLIAQGHVTITVRERFTADSGDVAIRPTSQIPGLSADDFVIQSAIGPQVMDSVPGINIGPDSLIRALVIAPNARVDFGNDVSFKGALIARRVILGERNVVEFEDGVPGEDCQPYDCSIPLDDGDPCTTDACTEEGGPTHDPAPDGTVCEVEGEGGACVQGVCEEICNEQAQLVKGNPRLEYMATQAPNPTPRGWWVVRYVDGCMKYNPLWWWSVNGTENGEYAWYLVEENKRTILPGTFGFFNSNTTPSPDVLPGFQTFEECVEANLEKATPQVFYHDGNDRMRIYLADHPYTDNRHGLLGRNPIWSLTPFECGAE
jgi:hypothetical protein